MTNQPANPDKKTRILFLGHDASRTGAPLLMLTLIRWLREHSDIDPSVMLLAGGDLEAQYQSLAPTARYDLLSNTLNRGIGRKVMRHLGRMKPKAPNLAELYPPSRYPIVYANTVVTLKLATQLAGAGRRVVLHVHELSSTADFYAVKEALKASPASVDAYIAASHAVRDFLETDIAVPREKIQVIHEFPVAMAKDLPRSGQGSALRRRLGISDTARVVGMCGWPQWRKGVDLFVQLADHIKRGAPHADYHCVWVGGDHPSHAAALHDVAKLGLQGVCHFVPAVDDPSACFASFDLFALTSREDPFSVAMLEAADHRLPVVCFADAGGAPELVETDAGVVVPYLNIPAMATACLDLLGDDALRHRFGDSARMKVRSRYTLETLGPKFLGVLKPNN